MGTLTISGISRQIQANKLRIVAGRMLRGDQILSAGRWRPMTSGEIQLFSAIYEANDGDGEPCHKCGAFRGWDDKGNCKECGQLWGKTPTDDGGNYDAATPNCGIGADGFQPGNTCGALPGGAATPAPAAAIPASGLSPSNRDQKPIQKGNMLLSKNMRQGEHPWRITLFENGRPLKDHLQFETYDQAREYLDKSGDAKIETDVSKFAGDLEALDSFDAEFEQQHPRADDGKFGEGSGDSSASSEDAPLEDEPSDSNNDVQVLIKKRKRLQLMLEAMPSPGGMAGGAVSRAHAERTKPLRQAITALDKQIGERPKFWKPRPATAADRIIARKFAKTRSMAMFSADVPMVCWNGKLLRGNDVLDRGVWRAFTLEELETFAAEIERDEDGFPSLPVEYMGLKINIENPAGSVRSGTDKSGKAWSVTMQNAYGFLKRGTGEDGEGLDVFLGRDRRAKDVYVVHQNDPGTGVYDEDKVMLGFSSPDDAKAAYLANYSSPKFFRSMTIIPLADFKAMLTNGRAGGAHWKRKLKREHETAAMFAAFAGMTRQQIDNYCADPGVSISKRSIAMQFLEMANFAADSKDSGWITIGGGPGEHGDHEGGTPVKIGDGGRIEAGPKELEGRTLDNLKSRPTREEAAPHVERAKRIEAGDEEAPPTIEQGQIAAGKENLNKRAADEAANLDAFIPQIEEAVSKLTQRRDQATRALENPDLNDDSKKYWSKEAERLGTSLEKHEQELMRHKQARAQLQPQDQVGPGGVPVRQVSESPADRIESQVQSDLARRELSGQNAQRPSAAGAEPADARSNIDRLKQQMAENNAVHERVKQLKAQGMDQTRAIVQARKEISGLKQAEPKPEKKPTGPSWSDAVKAREQEAIRNEKVEEKSEAKEPAGSSAAPDAGKGDQPESAAGTESSRTNLPDQQSKSDAERPGNIPAMTREQSERAMNWRAVPDEAYFEMPTEASDAPYKYYSKSRPLGAQASNEVLGAGAKRKDRFVWSDKPLPPELIAKNELTAMDGKTGGPLLKEQYDREHGAPKSGIYEFMNPHGQGLTIHPSSKERGKFQASRFDKNGFMSDTTHDSIDEAVAHAAENGFTRGKPGLLDQASKQSSFVEGSRQIQKLKEQNEALARKRAEKKPDSPAVAALKEKMNPAESDAEKISKIEVPKKPHEMGRDEYARESWQGVLQRFRDRPDILDSKNRDEEIEHFKQLHTDAVAKAIEDGKIESHPDYPRMAKKTTALGTSATKPLTPPEPTATVPKSETSNVTGNQRNDVSGAGAVRADAAPDSSGRSTPRTPAERLQQFKTASIRGRETNVRLAGGQKLKARYAVADAEEITPSHDPRNQWQKNELGDINERPYHDPNEGRESRATVERIAADTDFELLHTDTPTAIDGPPIVSDEGIVYGGNARTMGQQLAYHRAGESAEALRKSTLDAFAKFGIDPKSAQGIKNPVIVRVVEGQHGRGQLSRVLNDALSAGKSSATEAVSRANKISESTADRIGEMLSAEDAPSMREVLSNPDSSASIIKGFMRDGAWNDSDLTKYTDPKSGALNDEGKAVIERSLVGRLIDDPGVLANATPQSKSRVMAALPELLRATQKEPKFKKWLFDAVASYGDYKASGLPLEDFYFRQQTMTPAPGFGNRQVATIADAMDKLGPKKFRDAARGMLDSLGAGDPSQQRLGFAIGGKTETPEDAVAENFGKPQSKPANLFAADPPAIRALKMQMHNSPLGKLRQVMQDAFAGAFNESDHPRGQPANPGQFVAKGAQSSPSRSSASIADYKPDRPLTGESSKAISDIVGGDKVSDYFRVPGLSKMHRAMGVDENSEQASKEYLDARKRLFKSLPEYDIPLANISYTQPRVNMNRVAELMKAADAGAHEAAFFVKDGDTYHLMNGHHRVIAKQQAGETSIRGKVFDPESSEPASVAHIGAITAAAPLTHPHTGREAVFAQAAQTKPEYDKVIDDGQGVSVAIGARTFSDFGKAIEDMRSGQTGPIVTMAPLKGEARSAEKVESKFGGDYGKLTDVVRGTIAVDSVSDIVSAVESIQEHVRNQGWEIAELDNKFVKPTAAGYRDLSFKLRAPNGHITELQVNTKAMMLAKEDGHKLYESARSIDAAAMKEGRKLTGEESAQIESLNKQMSQMYSAAWEKSQVASV